MANLPPRPNPILEELRQRLADYFEFYRKGNERRWDKAARAHVYRNLRTPKPGRWTGHQVDAYETIRTRNERINRAEAAKNAKLAAEARQQALDASTQVGGDAASGMLAGLHMDSPTPASQDMDVDPVSRLGGFGIPPAAAYQTPPRRRRLWLDPPSRSTPQAPPRRLQMPPTPARSPFQAVSVIVMEGLQYLRPKKRRSGSLSSRKVTADRSIKDVVRRLQPYGLTFRKILGYGGLGVAALFNVHGDTADGSKGGETVPIVVKCDLGAGVDLIADEKRNHEWVARAMHVVQRMVFATSRPRGAKTDGKSAVEAGKKRRASEVTGGEEAGVPPKRKKLPSGRPAAMKFHRAALNEDDTILVLEYMPYGDLYHWLITANEKQETFPNMVLWKIFNSLFKGCVAMAFPPRSWTKDYQASGGRDGPLVDEAVPPRGSNLADYIHFDIDPQNILVGHFNVEDDKELCPVFKISDLGLMEPLLLSKRQDDVRMWSTRKCGKAGWYTPEQFHEEWDYLEGAPIKDSVKLPQIAGNFHWSTNLWQVGQVMWTLITLHKPPKGPIPGCLDREEAEDGSTKEFWTYGSFLMDEERFGNVDIDLRFLVARCMMDKPADRPSMQELQAAIQAKLNQELDLDAPEIWSDEDIMDWSSQFFGMPPNMPTWRPQDIQDWLDDKVDLVDDSSGSLPLTIGTGNISSAARKIQGAVRRNP